MRPRSPLEKTALSFIAGGALGNVIDRAMLGYVRDFIATEFMDFPVFNIADCSIVLGAGLLILYFILDMINEVKSIIIPYYFSSSSFFFISFISASISSFLRGSRKRRAGW